MPDQRHHLSSEEWWERVRVAWERHLLQTAEELERRWEPGQFSKESLEPEPVAEAHPQSELAAESEPPELAAESEPPELAAESEPPELEDQL